ncbi:MAG TPA: P1 family peptidase [Actinomycetota bacterium]|nr:P1 family peptidase [Actinomycetota bacterium]
MITSVPGVLVGHWSDPEAATGCTVIMLPAGTIGACAIVGGAPGTRQTDDLRPSGIVSDVNAFLFSGGSSFGLAATDGVMQVCESRGIGIGFGGAVVPIVPTAVIFDLGIGDAARRPGPAEGRAAAESATEHFEEGSVGAGTGATVAKWGGMHGARKGGVGTASASSGDVIVGALVVNNAAGDIVDEQGRPLAAARVPAEAPWALRPRQATVLAAVVTNAKLDKATASHVAVMATAGVSRSVRPAHTQFDGDVTFVGATGEVPAEPTVVGALGAEAVAEAMRRSVRLATGLAGIPGLADGRRR